MFPGLGLYYADPAQPLSTAGEELDDLYDLDHDLSDLSEVCNSQQCGRAAAQTAVKHAK